MLLRRAIEKHLRRFRKSTNGATAIEFAILLFPMLLVMLAIFEVAMVSVASLVLSNATAETARAAQTGDIIRSSISRPEFKQTLCEEIKPLLSCDEVFFDLREYDSFASLPRSLPVVDGNFDSSGFIYTMAGQEKIMALRVYYEWPLVTAYLHKAFANLNNGKYLLSATMSFRVEPWEE